jgi:trehalose 6-phosphate synthase
LTDQRQLIVIANRLPVRRPQEQERGAWALSPGGVVSALRPVLQRSNGVWLGWTGQTGPAPTPFEHDGIDMIPVRVNRKEAEQYYWGFSNRTLWPLYHDAIRWPEYHREWWHAYLRVNERFAAAAADVAAEGALVWIHDFHLQLVPRLLRERRADLRIGFFLHIPFPPAELFAQLPWRKQILEGILGADVIGFQTSLAAANFRSLARRYTKARISGDQLAIDNRTVIVDAFPISVDFESLDALARRDESHAIALRHSVSCSPKIN